MPLQRCEEKGQKGWAWGSGKCYVYTDKITEKAAKKRAIAQGLAIGAKFAKTSIMFDTNTPANIIRFWSTQGHRVFIWGGNDLDLPYKPVYTLAKEADINQNDIRFGKLSLVMDRNRVGIFMSKDLKYSNIKGFSHIGDYQDQFGQVLEQWVTMKDDKVCPICADLENLGPVPKGQLPAYRTAHETIGGPTWAGGNKSCRCYKQFTYSANTEALSDIESLQDKISEIFTKHSDCDCDGH